MLYAMTGVRAVSGLPGCPAGHTWEERADKSDPHMSVDCPVHVAHLAKDPLWSPSPAHVPLNDTEQKAADEAKAGREKAVFENAASTAAAVGSLTDAIGSISQVLGGLVDRVSAMQPPQGAPAVPEAAVPAAVTPEPAKTAAKSGARKPRAAAAVPA